MIPPTPSISEAPLSFAPPATPAHSTMCINNRNSGAGALTATAAANENAAVAPATPAHSSMCVNRMSEVEGESGDAAAECVGDVCKSVATEAEGAGHTEDGEEEVEATGAAAAPQPAESAAAAAVNVPISDAPVSAAFQPAVAAPPQPIDAPPIFTAAATAAAAADVITGQDSLPTLPLKEAQVPEHAPIFTAAAAENATAHATAGEALREAQQLPETCAVQDASAGQEAALPAVPAKQPKAGGVRVGWASSVVSEASTSKGGTSTTGVCFVFLCVCCVCVCACCVSE